MMGSSYHSNSLQVPEESSFNEIPGHGTEQRSFYSDISYEKFDDDDERLFQRDAFPENTDKRADPLFPQMEESTKSTELFNNQVAVEWLQKWSVNDIQADAFRPSPKVLETNQILSYVSSDFSSTSATGHNGDQNCAAQPTSTITDDQDESVFDIATSTISTATASDDAENIIATQLPDCDVNQPEVEETHNQNQSTAVAEMQAGAHENSNVENGSIKPLAPLQVSDPNSICNELEQPQPPPAMNNDLVVDNFEEEIAANSTTESIKILYSANNGDTQGQKQFFVAVPIEEYLDIMNRLNNLSPSSNEAPQIGKNKFILKSKDMEELDSYCEKLNDTVFRQRVVKALSRKAYAHVKSSHPRKIQSSEEKTKLFILGKFIRYILSKLMTDELAQSFSLAGIKGSKKKGFNKTVLYNVVQDAVKDNILFTQYANDHNYAFSSSFKKHVAEWFKAAKKRVES